MNRLKEIKQSIELCLDVLDSVSDPETIIYFSEYLEDLSEEFKSLLKITMLYSYWLLL